MSSGTLTIVGTGIKLVAHMTLEAHNHITRADKLFFVVTDPATRKWIGDLNPNGESLHTCFMDGKSRYEAYELMVERILEPLRDGLRVCAAFYGHPGVFVYPSHQAIARARAEGFTAAMLPGISAEDCLFADLDVDPARSGCQSFEATDFLVYRRRPDVSSALILWQIGTIGQLDVRASGYSMHGLGILVETLLKYYPSDHESIIYEAAQFSVCYPVMRKLVLAELSHCHVSTFSTLYVPPAHFPIPDPIMLQKLNMQYIRPQLDSFTHLHGRSMQ